MPAAGRSITFDPAFGAGGVFERAEKAPFGDLFGDASLDPHERLVILATAYVGNNQTEPVVVRLGDPPPPAAAPVNLAPHARMKRVPKKIRADRLNGFVGTANDPDGQLARVQVAVERKRRGAPGGRKGARGSGKSLRPRFCVAMKNAKGQFRRFAAGRAGVTKCPKRWLNVKGTAKWGYKLKRDLASGRYVVYARAVDAAGLAETTFTRKAGNRYAFRVLPAD